MLNFKLKIYLLFLSIFFIYGFGSFNGNAPKNEVELGKLLFFEKKLSKNNTFSCATCHKPEFAFADTTAVSKGEEGLLGKRNVPSIMNMKERALYFYDGRAGSLEEQVHFPIEDKIEMNNNFDSVVNRLGADKYYKKWFFKIYGEKPNKTNISKSIAAFERSLETIDTPFDDFMQDKRNNLSESAKNGRRIFISDRAKCFECHFGPDLTGDEFINIGLYNGINLMDKGRFEITKDSVDIGKFKVPGLRNVALTAPYMHNGMFKTLEEVINYYSNPNLAVSNPLYMDERLMEPKNFTETEKMNLIHFLESLTDKQFLKNK